MNLTVIENLLKKTQLQIDTATSGMECIDMLHYKHYDMIFLDHRMPEMDGIETFRLIQKNKLHCPIISAIWQIVINAQSPKLLIEALGFKQN